MKRIITSAALLAFSTIINAQEIDITGKNISIPSGNTITIANDNTFFGEQIIASGSISKTFWITNTGTVNLVLSGSPLVSLNNADYSVTTMPSATVAPGGATKFVISFDPSTVATINATVSIANNDANENPYLFKISGVGLSSRLARWVNNSGGTRPSTVSLSGDTYSTAATTYTTIKSAVNASNPYDIVYVSNGRYVNPAEFTSTICIVGGYGQDTNLFIPIKKHNLLITSETGDYKTSSAKLVGYSFNIIDTLGNVTIQGFTMDSIRQNAIYNSDLVFMQSSLNSPNVRIIKNKIMNVRGHGIKTDTRAAFAIDRGMWEITGNHFENIGYYVGANSAPCSTANTSAMWLGEAGSSFEIMNNTIMNTKWAGILCDGFSNPSGSIYGALNISGNKIYNTGNSGIQIGMTSAGGFYFPRNANITNNYIENANISHAPGIGGVVMLISALKSVNISSNTINSSFNGVAIDIAGWIDQANDTTLIRYNNFCNIVSGSYAIGHFANISPNGLFGTGDDLFKYKFDRNYYGSSTGPTYSSNIGGVGAALYKESIGNTAAYSINNFNYLPFSTSANVLAITSPGTIDGSQAICQGAAAIYSVAPVAGATSYSWTLPNGWTGTSNTNTISVTSNTTGGTIQVLTSTSCGTTGVSSTTITMNALPNVSAISSNTNICVGESATLTASNASTYVWNGTSNGSTYVISPAMTTIYSVLGTDNNGCSKSFTISQSVSPCTGINKHSNETNAFQVYPNPSNGKITLNSFDKEVALTISNQLGQVVKIVNLNKSNNFIAVVNELNEGLYFVSGENNNQIITQKIVISK